MAKIFSLYLLLICSVCASYAQKPIKSTDTIILVGKISIDQSANYEYKLRFTIDAKSNIINGLSLTDYGGPNETKAKIIGTYNPKKESFTFHETEVLKSKVKLDPENFCFIHATIETKKLKLLQTYKGDFIGKKSDGKTLCGKGNIQLLNPAKVKVLMQKIEQKNKELETAKALAKETKAIKENLIIVTDSTPILNVKGAAITLSVWDKGQVDGDIISLYCNQELLLDKYILTEARKIIKVPLIKNSDNIIKLVAHNEGKVPPNTAMVKIETDTEMYPIEVRASVEEAKTIILKTK